MPRLRRARSGAVVKKHVAVLCFSGAEAGHTLDALGDFCRKGSRVTFICRWGGVGGAWVRGRLSGTSGGGRTQAAAPRLAPSRPSAPSGALRRPLQPFPTLPQPRPQHPNLPASPRPRRRSSPSRAAASRSPPSWATPRRAPSCRARGWTRPTPRCCAGWGRTRSRAIHRWGGGRAMGVGGGVLRRQHATCSLPPRAEMPPTSRPPI
jgi:hypothetical protein